MFQKTAFRQKNGIFRYNTKQILASCTFCAPTITGPSAPLGLRYPYLRQWEEYFCGVLWGTIPEFPWRPEEYHGKDQKTSGLRCEPFMSRYGSAPSTLQSHSDIIHIKSNIVEGDQPTTQSLAKEMSCNPTHSNL